MREVGSSSKKMRRDKGHWVYAEGMWVITNAFMIPKIDLVTALTEIVDKGPNYKAGYWRALELAKDLHRSELEIEAKRGLELAIVKSVYSDPVPLPWWRKLF
jgi:hypothetical protein